MKIICAADKIREAVENTERVITKNTTLPILNNILLEAHQNELIVSATNLEIASTVHIPCKTIQEGSISVPARIMRGILNHINEDKIELEEKNLILYIRTGKYTGELKGHKANDFPIIPNIKSQIKLTVSGTELSSALSQVVSFTSTSETRPEITGVYITKPKNQETISFVSTDSFRLAERKIFLKKEFYSVDLSFIVPHKTATEVLRLFSGEDEVEIGFDKNQALFSSPSRRVVSRLIEGTYPQYAALIPTEFTTEITLNKDEFARAVKLVSLLSSRINDIHVVTDQKNKKIHISARDPDLGENTASIDADIEGEDIEINFNWHYLIEGLQHAEGSAVTVKLTGETKPVLIRASDKALYLYIVMPIRV